MTASTMTAAKEVMKEKKQPKPALTFTFHTFTPDGAGGHREVTSPNEMRQVAVRMMLAGAGIAPTDRLCKTELAHE